MRTAAFALSRSLTRSLTLSLTLSITITLALTGCSTQEPRVCTEIGCASGLWVDLEGTPTYPFTLRAAAGQQTESITCQQATGCFLLFQDFTPAEVTVTYEAGGETVEQSFTPEYVRTRPNGEGCPPECVNATVVLPI